MTAHSTIGPLPPAYSTAQRAIRDYRTSGDVLILVLGMVTLLGGLGLVVYTIYLVRKLDRANVH